MKKMVWKENGYLSLEYEFAEDIIANLQRIVDIHGKKKVRIEKRSQEYSDSVYDTIMIERLETDAEEQKREANEEQGRVNQLVRDKATYEALRKKFE